MNMKGVLCPAAGIVLEWGRLAKSKQCWLGGAARREAGRNVWKRMAARNRLWQPITRSQVSGYVVNLAK